MNFKALLKTLAHGFVSAGAVAATTAIQSGNAITSGNVLVPAIVAGVLGALHAVLPSTITPAPTIIATKGDQ